MTEGVAPTRSAALSQKAALQMPFSVTTLPMKMHPPPQVKIASGGKIQYTIKKAPMRNGGAGCGGCAMKRRDFCKGLAAVLAAGALPLCTAAPQAEAATAVVGRVVPDDRYTLWYRSDRCGADLRHDYYYSDSLFDHSALEYNNRLALVTLGMTAAAGCTWESDQRYWMVGEAGRAAHIRDAFDKLGFTEVELINWDHSLNDAPDTVACAIARKTLVRGGRQVTIFGVFLRGVGYGAEWASNFHAGTGSAHQGFVAAARQLAEKLQARIRASANRQPLGTLKLWMGGYSRSAAVANLVAARLPALLPQLTRKNTFVYTFAAPAALTAADYPDLQQDYDNNHTAGGTLKAHWSSSNIFNLISSGDIVPRILPETWGYHRNGNDRFLPATTIPEELAALNERGAQLEGTPTVFDNLALPEETDAVLDSILTLFGSRQNYHAVYEDALRCMLQCANTRSEAEITQGVILDDAAIVARLRSMDTVRQFPPEKVERCVQAASAMSRPLLEKLGDSVPLLARQIVIPMLAVGMCFDLQTDALRLIADFVLSTITAEGQLNGILKTVLCHFLETYIVLLEYYDPADHGMEPYTRTPG